MTNQTENTDDLVINPNENDKFTDDARINELADSIETSINEQSELEDSEDSEMPEIEVEIYEEETTNGEKQASKKQTGVLLSIIIILLIVGGAFYAYTFHRDLLVQYIPFLKPTEQNKATVQLDTSTDSANETSNNEANEIDYTSTESTVETAVSDEEVADAITESMLQAAQEKSVKTATIEKTTAQIDFKKPLNRPTWVISVSSVAKESIAIEKTKELRVAGKTADYYWIPDYVNGGNRYFKVFVGPFATKTEAQKYLANGDLTNDAYVLKVE